MDQSFKLSDGYKNWTAFVDEFRRIEESLQESKTVERLLVIRCNQLKSELVVSGNKLHTVMSVRAEDERTMALLRKECDQSVTTAMEARLKEKQAMTLVSGLQADIEALQSQVGVLQSALWLERERATAAVKASRGALSVATRARPNVGGPKTTTMMTINPTSSASVAAAEAAAAAAGVLAASSTGGRGGGGGGGGGSSPQRRRDFPGKRAGGTPGARAAHPGLSSCRSLTAPAAAVAQRAQKNRRRTPTSGGAAGLYYGEGSSEFWREGQGDYCGDMGGGVGFGGLGADGNNAAGTALADEPSLGLISWENDGIDDYLHGGGGGGQQDRQQEPRIGHFVPDVDGRRGYGCGGGRHAGEAGSGGVGGVGGEIVTPFQKWKNDKGITSPGVAEMFAGQG